MENFFMKKSHLLLAILSLSLTGCFLLNTNNNSSENQSSKEKEQSSSETNNSSSDSTNSSSSNSDSSSHSSSEGGGEDNPSEIADVDSIQDMNILHAWNWKINDIKSRLSAIKNAGYGAIQISPMQPKVDKSNYSNQSTKSQWWKLYQPLAFKIAENEESFLGTKSDLISLCSEAKKQNIKIVVDIVSNHLAGTNNSYSNQVYTQYPLHTYGSTNDNSIQAVVQGHIGLPDLDTSKSQVQQDVLTMLKSYVDCGVSGFRFDAAKHIETPDDGDYASNYWPTILNGTTNYAKSKNLQEPYYYGEILNTCGTGRSFSSYTKMMSICDNNQGTSVVQAVNNQSLSSIKTTYNTGANPNHLVLWSESHDTYANDSGYDITRNYSTEVINKAYIIQASRKDAATLYLARPSSMDVTICSIDDNSGWKNQEVIAINKFHRRYVDKDEAINNNNGCFVNVRGTGSFAGAAIVNISGSTSKTVDVKGLQNGTYTDLITNKDFTVNNEKVTVSFTNGACILIPKGSSTGEDNPGGGEVNPTTYSSSVVLKGYNTSLSYLAWTWGNGNSGSWKAFNTDQDAIGVNLSSGDNYIIVEFPSGTTTSNANWDNKKKQTNDLLYSGTQIIHEYSSLTWK